MDYYLLLIWRGVEPTLLGPFKDTESRDKKAKRLKTEYGVTATFFPIKLSRGSEIDVDCYSADFFE